MRENYFDLSDKEEKKEIFRMILVFVICILIFLPFIFYGPGCIEGERKPLGPHGELESVIEIKKTVAEF